MSFTPTAPVVCLVQDLYQGTHYSDPVNWPSGATAVTANGLLSNEDGLNVALKCGWNIEVSFDNGKSYQHQTGYTWMGGPSLHDPSVPALPGIGCSFSASGNVPSQVRIRIESPQSISIGGSIVFA